MEINDIPFSAHAGIMQSKKEGVLLELPDSSIYHNHIGTVHASAQFTLAETAGGFLMQEGFNDIADEVIAVVRKAEVKYSKPAEGALFASGSLNNEDVDGVKQSLERYGLAKLRFMIFVKDRYEQVTMKARFEWSIIRKKENDNG